jgi:peptidoglycan/xylan/chitin deacetylase (PgdA/CDA1 family)
MLRILTYHRVADFRTTPKLHPRIISATPENFARQMRHLAKHYCVISMEEVLNAIERKTRLPEKAVLITFDDGYIDFDEIAWPILQYYRLPVTLFVPTAYPDQPERMFWWDRLYRAMTFSRRAEWNSATLGALSLRTSEQRDHGLRLVQRHVKTLAHTEAMRLVDEVCQTLGEEHEAGKTVLSWEELRRLAKDGVTIGPHTQTHPILTRLSEDAARSEISGSLADLRRELGNVLPIFCYPDGGHNQKIVNLIRQNDCRLAFTTMRGFNHFGAIDPLRLHRNNVSRNSSLPIFRLRLLPLMSYLESWRD